LWEGIGAAWSRLLPKDARPGDFQFDLAEGKFGVKLAKKIFGAGVLVPG